MLSGEADNIIRLQEKLEEQSVLIAISWVVIYKSDAVTSVHQ